MDNTPPITRLSRHDDLYAEGCRWVFVVDGARFGCRTRASAEAMRTRVMPLLDKSTVHVSQKARKPRVTLTPEIVDRVLGLLASGMTVAKVCGICNLSKGCVTRIKQRGALA